MADDAKQIDKSDIPKWIKELTDKDAAAKGGRAK
jgi:hypothetical protein